MDEEYSYSDRSLYDSDIVLETELNDDLSFSQDDKDED